MAIVILLHIIITMTIALAFQRAPLSTGCINVNIWQRQVRILKEDPTILNAPMIPAHRRMSWASRRYSLPWPILNLNVGEGRPDHPKNLELAYIVSHLSVALVETGWHNKRGKLGVVMAAAALPGRGAWTGSGESELLRRAARAARELKKMLVGRNGGGGRKRNWN